MTTERPTVFRIECRNGRTQRHVVGERHPKATISDDTVEALRAAYEREEGGYRALSRRFGLRLSTVKDLITMRRRAHG